MVMDVYQDSILVTYRPFDVHIFHVKLFAFYSMRTLNQSIMTAKSHPAAIRFVPDQLPRDRISDNHLPNSNPLLKEPARCLILRVNGELSLLDLDDGHEMGAHRFC